MADLYSATAPLVLGWVMPSSGLTAVGCPWCRQVHLQHAAGGPLKAPCGGGVYRIRIAGTADASMARRIRDALSAKHNMFDREEGAQPRG